MIHKTRKEWTGEQAIVLYNTIEALLNQFESENRKRRKRKTK